MNVCYRWDNFVIPTVRAAGGGLAPQGREQELLPAQGLRVPAFPGIITPYHWQETEEHDRTCYSPRDVCEFPDGLFYKACLVIQSYCFKALPFMQTRYSHIVFWIHMKGVMVLTFLLRDIASFLTQVVSCQIIHYRYVSRAAFLWCLHFLDYNAANKTGIQVVSQCLTSQRLKKAKNFSKFTTHWVSTEGLSCCQSFQDESSVAALMEACITDDDKLYLCVSSPTIRDKPVQIRPWRLADADFVLDASMPLDPRKTVFVGGVPRPLKAGKSLHCLYLASDGPTSLDMLTNRSQICGYIFWPMQKSVEGH